MQIILTITWNEQAFFFFLQNCKGFIVYNHILISEQILEKTITIPDVEQ